MIIKKNNRINFLKYFDKVSFILLLFVIITSFFIYNLNKINEKIENFNIYYSNVINLKILHNEFNNFINNKATFINYDNLNKKISETEVLISSFDTENFYKNYGYNFENLIKNLSHEWQEEIAYIERFKSLNSSVVGSLNYILELSQSLRTKYLMNSIKDIIILDNALNSSTKLFVNNEGNNFEIAQININNLDSLVEKYNVSEIRFLTKRLKSLSSDLEKINNTKIEYSKLEYKNFLNKIETELNNINNINLKRQKNLSFILFVASIFLLCSFIYTYQKSLKTKNELNAFKYAVANSDNSIVITDENRNILYVNEAFEKATGYTKDEMIGQNPRILKSGLLPAEFYKNINAILDRGEKWIGEFKNKKKNGEIYYETASITPIILNENIKGYLAIKLDVTDYIKEKEKVEFLAYHDSLTMLPNRRSLQIRVEKIIEDSFKNNKKFALLFIDLDGFKVINDVLGHDTGDKLLKEVSLRFKNIFDGNSLVFRIGGDEFAIIFEYENDDLIILNAQYIIKNLNETIVIGNNSLHIGCSIGIARYPLDGDDLVSLLKHSDTAMYKAKQKSKNRYEFYTEDLTKTVSSRLKIEQALSKALENEEFYVVYQPKYNLKTKEIFSVETLLRWKSPILGNVSPDEFIYIAEEIGLIHELGFFVFKKACEDFVKLQNKINIQMITINVSTLQLVRSNFIDEIKKILIQTNIDTINIGIEITETYFIENMKDTEKSLNELQNLGFKILIDDFGTGYSSLQYLQKLPIDIIKIDKSFVSSLDDNNDSIIRAIVALSKSFNYTTVAEGIETKEQEDKLIELGVDFGQGYLFSKPKLLIEF
ncbi:EAL domain-containing protein [Aliarcobacter butzleri]|uniref:EAL domain-containing protein n=1 Tax=Aliarcobacter butzleri TaxID=28197 RepID=UPI000674CB70|nr:EAL domain-containing protein [Aliarcobacter butzleri]